MSIEKLLDEPKLKPEDVKDLESGVLSKMPGSSFPECECIASFEIPWYKYPYGFFHAIYDMIFGY